MWGKCVGKVIEKLNFVENGKCFQTFLSLCSSKIKRNCTLVNRNINLQLAYYILEFQEKEPRGVFRTLSNIYDKAFSRILFPQRLHHRFLKGS